MEPNLTENTKQVAAVIHLSTFTKFFFPLGNFLAPLLLWTVNKNKAFINEHGRQAINFQLSILLYTVLIGIICLPFFVMFAPDFVELVDAIDHHVQHNSINSMAELSGYFILFFVAAVVLLSLFIFELYAVITATVQANRGELYKYPLSIPFIKSVSEETGDVNQSKNEHVS